MPEPIIAENDRGEQIWWNGSAWVPVESTAKPETPENPLTPGGKPAASDIPNVLEGGRKGLGRLGVGAAEITHAVSPEVAAAARKELQPKDVAQTLGGMVSQGAVAALVPGQAVSIPGALAREAAITGGLAALESGGDPATTGQAAVLGGAAGAAGRMLPGMGASVRQGAARAVTRYLQPAATKTQQDLATKVAEGIAQERGPLFNVDIPGLRWMPRSQTSKGFLERAQARLSASKAGHEAEVAAASDLPVDAAAIRTRNQGVREKHEVAGGGPKTFTVSRDLTLSLPDRQQLAQDIASGQADAAKVAASMGISDRELIQLLQTGRVPRVDVERTSAQVAIPSRRSHGALSKLDQDIARTQEEQGAAISADTGIPMQTDAAGRKIVPPEVDFKRLYGYEGKPGEGRAGLLPQYERQIREYNFGTGRGPAHTGTSEASLKEMAGVLRGERRAQFPELEPGFERTHRDIGIQDFAEQRVATGELTGQRQIYDSAAAANQALRVVMRPGGGVYAVPLLRELLLSSPWQSLSAGARISIANALESGSAEVALKLFSRAFASEAARQRIEEKRLKTARLADRQRIGALKE